MSNVTVASADQAKAGRSFLKSFGMLLGSIAVGALLVSELMIQLTGINLPHDQRELLIERLLVPPSANRTEAVGKLVRLAQKSTAYWRFTDTARTAKVEFDQRGTLERLFDDNWNLELGGSLYNDIYVEAFGREQAVKRGRYGINKITGIALFVDEEFKRAGLGRNANHFALTKFWEDEIAAEVAARAAVANRIDREAHQSRTRQACLSPDASAFDLQVAERRIISEEVTHRAQLNARPSARPSDSLEEVFRAKVAKLYGARSSELRDIEQAYKNARRQFDEKAEVARFNNTTAPSFVDLNPTDREVRRNWEFRFWQDWAKALNLEISPLSSGPEVPEDVQVQIAFAARKVRGQNCPNTSRR